MECEIRIVLKDDGGRPFMGIGLIWLLEGIAQHQSISEAARSMHLSYPKAIRMLRDLERGLDRPVIVRHKGGNSRGGAELTPFGIQFVERYKVMQNTIKEYANHAFTRDFADLIQVPMCND